MLAAALSKVMPLFVTETRSAVQVRGVQDHRPPVVRADPDRPAALHLQGHLPRRGREGVPRAGQHRRHPPLGAPPLAEGQVQAVRQGEWRCDWATGA